MPNTQLEHPQPFDLPEQSRSQTSMAIDSTVTKTEVVHIEITTMASEEEQIDDPLKNFLPPPATTKCAEELQVFLSLKLVS